MPKFALTAALAAALVSPAMAGDFDGTWSVQLVTESGLCDAQYSYTLAVRGGQVRPIANASSGSTTVTGVCKGFSGGTRRRKRAEISPRYVSLARTRSGRFCR